MHKCRASGFVALFAAVLVAMVAVPALAAPLSLQIDRSSIAINEAVEVVIQVNARHATLRPPRTDDFEVTNATSPFNQPMFCMSMGLEVVSGPCTFRFYFAPQKAGTLTIPSFQLVDSFYRPGQLVGRTNEVTIEVSPDKVSNPQGVPRSGRRQGRRNQGRRSPRQVQKSNGPAIAGADQEPVAPSELKSLDAFGRYDLFLIPQTEKDAYVINEPFNVDFVLYVGDDSGASQLQGLELPELDGFRKERLEGDNAELGDVNIGNKHFSRYLLSRYVLVPMEPGARLVDGAKATVLAQSSRIQQFQGGFSISIQSGSQPVEVYAPALKLQINEPPRPFPKGFSTANVGKFELRNVVPPEPQPAGTWMVLKYDLVGAGNLLSVSVPVLPEGDTLEVRKPHLDNAGVTIDERGVHGTLKVQLPFRVTRAGGVPLPPLEFDFYNPDSGEFEHLTVPLPKVVAEAPVAVEGEVAVPDSTALAPLATDGPLTAAPPDDPWRRGIVVSWFLAALLGLYLLALLVRALLSLGDRDPIRRKRKQALRRARNDLTDARKHLAENRPDQFYAALTRSLSGYLEGRFGVLASSSTFDVLEADLRRVGVPEELARQVREELEGADFGRFAPTALQNQDMAATLNRIKDVMARLDGVKGVKA